MSKKTKKLLLSLVIIAVLLTPFFVVKTIEAKDYNANFEAPKAPENGFALKGRTLLSTVNPILTWVTGIIGIICVIFVVMAGVKMATSGDNEDNRKKAIKTLTWAMIGLIVTLAAYAIVAIVGSGIESKF